MTNVEQSVARVIRASVYVKTMWLARGAIIAQLTTMVLRVAKGVYPANAM